MSRNESKSLSILFFLSGRDVPSSRFRVNAYERNFRSSGIAVKNLYTRPSKFLWYPRIIRNTPLVYPWAGVCLLIVVLTRVSQILLHARRHDVIVLQKSMLHRVTIPFLEALLFRYICGRRRKGLCRVVFDVDDATYLGKHGEESFNSVPDYIARNSDLVIAGNQYLSQHFSRIAKCIVIPTCVDLERYRQKNWDLIDRVDHQIVIGWTGLSTNLKYLVSLESVLGKLKQDFDFRLVIICEADTANPFPDSNLDVEMRAWSKVSEIEDLSEIDIGLMPLVDDAWSRGKCGFKLIQYMAIGMASVASPVGVNKEIIKHGANGYLASNEEEWIHCLSDLLGNKRRIKEFGLAGRLATIERFSTDRWSKNLIDALCLRNGQQRSED